VEDHHANERERLFLYCITENDPNPRYLSLQRSCTLNESLVLSYLYVNKLTIHPECKKLGIDQKISSFKKMLDLDKKEEFSSEASKQYERLNEEVKYPAAAGSATASSAKPQDAVDIEYPSAFTKQPPMVRGMNIAQLHPGNFRFETLDIATPSSRRDHRKPKFGLR
jgi:hypothetical protein